MFKWLKSVLGGSAKSRAPTSIEEVDWEGEQMRAMDAVEQLAPKARVEFVRHCALAAMASAERGEVALPAALRDALREALEFAEQDAAVTDPTRDGDALARAALVAGAGDSPVIQQLGSLAAHVVLVAAEGAEQTSKNAFLAYCDAMATARLLGDVELVNSLRSGL